MRHFTPPRDVLRSAARTLLVHHGALHLLAALISESLSALSESSACVSLRVDHSQGTSGVKYSCMQVIEI